METMDVAHTVCMYVCQMCVIYRLMCLSMYVIMLFVCCVCERHTFSWEPMDVSHTVCMYVYVCVCLYVNGAVYLMYVCMRLR
jgi:hypothetical protein